MGLFSVEHGRLAYWADFAVHGGAVAALAAVLSIATPAGKGPQVAAAAAAGLLGWTAIEYLLHRYVLHGLQPFRRWHLLHHGRPKALMGSPTILSASLIAVFVFLPAWAVAGLWGGEALTLGVLGGYLAYGLTHHAVHHWRADSAWLKQRKRWHALHHHVDPDACYGVTSAFWDHVFGTARRRSRAVAC